MKSWSLTLCVHASHRDPIVEIQQRQQEDRAFGHAGPRLLPALLLACLTSFLRDGQAPALGLPRLLDVGFLLLVGRVGGFLEALDDGLQLLGGEDLVAQPEALLNGGAQGARSLNDAEVLVSLGNLELGGRRGEHDDVVGAFADGQLEVAGERPLCR